MNPMRRWALRNHATAVDRGAVSLSGQRRAWGWGGCAWGWAGGAQGWGPLLLVSGGAWGWAGGAQWRGGHAADGQEVGGGAAAQPAASRLGFVT